MLLCYASRELQINFKGKLLYILYYRAAHRMAIVFSEYLLFILVLKNVFTLFWTSLIDDDNRVISFLLINTVANSNYNQTFHWRRHLICFTQPSLSLHSLPFPTIFKPNRESFTDEGNVTTSVLELTPTHSDHGSALTCRAENLRLANSSIEDNWILNIFCEHLYKYSASHCSNETFE